jgi:hypothetical protein
MGKNIKPIVLEWTPTPDSGNLRGLFAVQIGSCEFRKLRLVQQQGQAPFATPPQETYTDKSGQKRFVTLVKWPAEWSKPILDAMLEAMQDSPAGIRRLAGSSFGDAVRERAGIGGRQ